MSVSAGGDVSVGARLREARKRQGLSLAQLSDTTKISRKALLAIERDDIALLPGGIFTRGFLRAYASAVGLDPEEIVREYIAEFEPPSPQPAAEPRSEDLPGDAERRPSWLSLIATGALLVVAVMAHSYISNRGAADRQPVTAAADAVHAVATSGRGRDAAGGPPAVAAVRRSPRALTIEMQATELCWVSATSDGLQVFRRLMDSGERETVTGDREVVLRVGDPAAFRFSINGVTARALGSRGEAATAVITSENYRSFFAR